MANLKLVVDNKAPIVHNKEANEVASLLKEAFAWSHTKQGFDYWQEVEQNLKEIAHDTSHLTR